MNFVTRTCKFHSSECKILVFFILVFSVRYHDRIIDKKLAKIYVIMEYCEGGDLGQEILKRRRRGRGFTEARIWKTFTQVSAKPSLVQFGSNMFLDSFGF